VVDDNEWSLKLGAMILADAGYAVETAGDGEDAWRKLQSVPFDLLLTDYQMPLLNGLGLSRRVRAAGMQLPIVLASGFLKGQLLEAENARELQRATLLQKPFIDSELLSIVRSSLGSPPARASEAKVRVGQGPPAGLPQKTAESSFGRGGLGKEKPAVPPVPRGAGRHRVLVVDDDASVRGSLAAVLACEGFEVDEARDGLEAVVKAGQHRPDMVLLDLNMPQMDGWATFAELDRLQPLLPVIVITARPHQYPEAVRQGVDAFMEKPLNVPLLVCTVKMLSKEDPRERERRMIRRDFITTHLGAALAE
jgi:DNA-binding response OmpR family regulator